jgi:hypothetical protein
MEAIFLPDKQGDRLSCMKTREVEAPREETLGEVIAKEDAMPVESVEEYIRGLEDWQADLVTRLREIIKEAVPGVQESIKWGRPFFDMNGPICYIVAHSKSVNFGFWRGVELQDPQELMEGTGEKMRHIKLQSKEQIDKGAFMEFLKQAEKLNRG